MLKTHAAFRHTAAAHDRTASDTHSFGLRAQIRDLDTEPPKEKAKLAASTTEMKLLHTRKLAKLDSGAGTESEMASRALTHLKYSLRIVCLEYFLVPHGKT